MTNNLVPVISMNSKYIRWHRFTYIYINGILRNSCSSPISSHWYKYVKEYVRKEYINFFGQFIYSCSYKNIKNTDCFNQLYNMRDKKYLNRFLKFGTLEFIPSEIYCNLELESKIDSLKFKVDYMDVDEAVVSFLEQSGNKVLADELKQQFSEIVLSNLTQDELFELKAKQLSSLNLSDYFKHFPKKNTIIINK